MNRKEFHAKAESYLNTLCSVTPNRQVGSKGNHAATDFFAKTISKWGYSIDTTPFNCIDFEKEKPTLSCEDTFYETYVSPFSLGCDVSAELVVVSTIEELEKCSCYNKILLLKGPICSEQLMPKNFVFYNPDHHKKIYSLLEGKQPAAIITVTSKNPQLVGNIYPFPLINDGDFDSPSVYCTEVIGEKIASKAGKPFKLKMKTKRIPTTACNVIAHKKPKAKQKITLCAHIDAVENTPGASDNASGVVVLLLLAELLQDYQGQRDIEIIAFNGEDHYSAGGQMDYLQRHNEGLDQIFVAINIDDVGYFKGKTAYTFYECPTQIQQKTRSIFSQHSGVVEGEPWYSGDHMIFAQKSKATIAITTDVIAELMETITHSPKDTPEIIDCDKLVELAYALEKLVIGL